MRKGKKLTDELNISAVISKRACRRTDMVETSLGAEDCRNRSSRYDTLEKLANKLYFHWVCIQDLLALLHSISLGMRVPNEINKKKKSHSPTAAT